MAPLALSNLLAKKVPSKAPSTPKDPKGGREKQLGHQEALGPSRPQKAGQENEPGQVGPPSPTDPKNPKHPELRADRKVNGAWPNHEICWQEKSTRQAKRQRGASAPTWALG